MVKTQNQKTLVISVCAPFSQWCVMQMVNYRFALWSAVFYPISRKHSPRRLVLTYKALAIAREGVTCMLA